MSKAGEIAVKGVQTSRTLVPPRSKDVPLNMMNLRDVVVRLHDGATVGEPQPVNVVETFTPPTIEERQQECIGELICGTDYRLSAADKEKLSGLLKEFSDTLSVDEYDMDQTGVIQHHIDTGQKSADPSSAASTPTTSFTSDRRTDGVNDETEDH